MDMHACQSRTPFAEEEEEKFHYARTAKGL